MTKVATNVKLLEIIKQQTIVINELVGYVKELVDDSNCDYNLDGEMDELHKLILPFEDED